MTRKTGALVAIVIAVAGAFAYLSHALNSTLDTPSANPQSLVWTLSRLHAVAVDLQNALEDYVPANGGLRDIDAHLWAFRNLIREAESLIAAPEYADEETFTETLSAARTLSLSVGNEQPALTPETADRLALETSPVIILIRSSIDRAYLSAQGINISHNTRHATAQRQLVYVNAVLVVTLLVLASFALMNVRLRSRLSKAEDRFGVESCDLAARLEEASADRDRLKDCLEHLQLGVEIIDPKGVVCYVNEAFQNLWPEIPVAIGQPYREQLEQVLENDLVEEATARPEAWVSDRVDADGVPLKAKRRGELRRSDGRVFWVHRQMLENGFTVLVHEDITAHRNSQAQLVHASKLATLGEMSTAVAHEINQPLNVIQMAAGNARMRLEAGKIDTAFLTAKLERIEDQVVRATKIVQHMRLFGRKDIGRYEYIDPKYVIEDAIDLTNDQMRLAGIVVNTRYENTMMTYCQSLALEQVIINLLVNARDAIADLDQNETNDDRERCVEIETLDRDKTVRIVISDSGPGIPPDDITRIFEPFYTNKPLNKGTGLGLSVSYGIVKEFQGTIRAENRIEGGARFTIVLPGFPPGE